MKSITIRDLRPRWPAIEKTLQIENELIITRDGKPVARLVRVIPETSKRKRWTLEEHTKWIKKVWSDKIFPSADAAIARDRAGGWERESGWKN